ncbi:MAG: hypothetical protein AAFZ05_12795 [Pseudomonadota bacterium]
MRNTLRLAGLGLAVAVAVPTIAMAQVKSTQFGKAGNWTINAVTTKGGTFNHCSARAVYKSGMEVYLIAYNSGNWSIQFYRKDWPQRKETKFPATLIVDGREIMRTNARFRGRSAFIDLGRSRNGLRAIMQGNIMAVRSATGTSRYRLTGTRRAAQVATRCWRRYRKTITANRNDGAFGGGARTPLPNNRSNDGAFGSGSAKPSLNRNKALVSRGETLDLATRYLSRAKVRYQILPKERNVFRFFPVNWRYDNGTYGGMLVLRNSKFNAVTGLESLLKDQAKWCKGRSATDRKPVSGARGRQVARARGICEVNGAVTEIEYSVAELGDGRLMFISEGLRADKARKARPGGTAPAFPLPPSARPPSGSNATPRANRRPGPNEL